MDPRRAASAIAPRGLLPSALRSSNPEIRKRGRPEYRRDCPASAGQRRSGVRPSRLLKSQILFWLIGAPDGHAKNFSIFLTLAGRFRLTPLYDVLTTQPNLDAHEIKGNQFKLAMAVGTNRKYRISDIHGRHFVETGRGAGLPDSLIKSVIDDVRDGFERAFDRVQEGLPEDFADQVHHAVMAAARMRLPQLDTAGPELRR